LATEAVPLLVAVADAPRLETAARLGVGVQLAERGPPAQRARSCIGQSRVIAASIHDRAGLARRVAEGVDLVLLAPFGDVPGKGAPLSDDEVLEITEASVVPVLALGAIRSQLDVDRALALGCAGVAVRAFVGNAADGGAAITTLRGWIDASRRERDLARRSR
ncbi:MAG: thiamine phosphate synthase, partial [Deltaproteobacteria bacterium]|nr:thiamine phosphate synthase [Deltaproteobacteria bacterium]